MQFRKSKYFATLLLGAAVTVYAACEPQDGSCDSVNCVQEKSIELAKSLKANMGAVASAPTTIANPPACTSFQPSPSAEAEDALMFIDVTQSMAGFTAGTTFREFDDVMDAVSSALGLSRVVLFGKKGALFQERPAGSVLHDETVYTGGNNPDYCLWDFALNWDGDKPIAYLTDGVQSAASIGALGPSVDALKKWLERGRHVGIMAFRGKFSGRLWSEQAQNWIGVVPEDPETTRPFYLFVLASDEAELKAVFGRLDTILRPGGALHQQFGTNLTTVQFGERERVCTLTPTISFFVQNRMSNWTWVNNPKIPDFKTDPDTEIARWACNNLENAPSEPSQSGSVEFKYWEWDRTAGAFGAPANNPQGAQFNLEKNTLRGTIGSNVPTTTRYTFWALEVSGQRGPLRPDLRALSTSSDATLEAAGETYRFDWLIENLAAADFEHQRPTATLYLTLKP